MVMLLKFRLITKLQTMIAGLEGQNNALNEIYATGAVEGYSPEHLDIPEDCLRVRERERGSQRERER